jgi:F-type H+-transporting ATPase subunit epsilon
MKNFKLTITQIDGALFEGDAVSVTVPGEEGEMTILANHEPLITRLTLGTITVATGTEKKFFQIDSGVVEISESVTILL